MKEVTLRGTHFEMGCEIGAQMRGVGEELPALRAEQMRSTETLVRLVAGKIPNLLEEMRGIAEGGGYDELAVQAYSLALGIVPSCTVVAVSGARTATGRMLFGRNYDAGPKWADFTLYRTYPKKGLAHIGCCYDMLVGREDGMNEAGLAIAGAGVHGHYTTQLGVWDHIPVRAVLEQCETTREAEELLHGLPHLYTKSFLVADAGGDVAIIEAAQQAISVVHPKGGFGVIANHFVVPEMQRYNDWTRIPANSRERVERAEQWERASAALGADDMKRFLSSSGTGVRSELGPEFTTVWSWVAELGERRIDLCESLPDVGAYRVCDF